MNKDNNNENITIEKSIGKTEKSEKKTTKKKRSKKKMVLIIIAIFIIALLVFAGIMVALAYREIARDVSIKNPDGQTGTVFVVIRPGVSSFQDDVTNAMIQGLVKADWRVESTTSHKNTPTNVSKYNMFVFGSPTYGSSPHNTLLDYLKRVDLGGKPVVLLVTAGGDGKQAIDKLTDAVEKANGNVTAELELLTGDNSGGKAESKAYDLGKSFTEIPK